MATSSDNRRLRALRCWKELSQGAPPRGGRRVTRPVFQRSREAARGAREARSIMPSCLYSGQPCAHRILTLLK